jgi:hypothetical protein
VDARFNHEICVSRRCFGVHLPLHRRNRYKKKVADIGLQQIKLDGGIRFEHLAIGRKVSNQT